MGPSITAVFVFDRPAKRFVRFINDEWGVKYVPNARYEQLGRPQAIRVTVEAELVELAEAA